VVAWATGAGATLTASGAGLTTWGAATGAESIGVVDATWGASAFAPFLSILNEGSSTWLFYFFELKNMGLPEKALGLNSPEAEFRPPIPLVGFCCWDIFVNFYLD
jgi:hypothetical protein